MSQTATEERHAPVPSAGGDASSVHAQVEALCAQARAAAGELALAPTAAKDAALMAVAEALEASAAEILAANADDMAAGERAGLSTALLDRLRLDSARLEGIVAAVRAIVALGDPVGEVIEGRRLPNGLDLRKVRVPLGVVGVIYEARPNVTIDTAALCIKSGNAIVLRGSSAAKRSNAVLAQIASAAIASAGLPVQSITLLPGESREEIAALARQSRYLDLIVPRGGEELKGALQGVATVPVIYAASGNCHVYVDASADLAQAQRIVMNAKVQRPGVCNAAETLLVHAAIAERFLPAMIAELLEAGVQLRADPRVIALAGEHASSLQSASAEDWEREYLDLTLAVGIVDSLEQAIAHINRYGSGHSEAIVTSRGDAARSFQRGVDAACVYVNASTRFTDGGELGMGAEIGNSTQKLHARGPLGLRELCTYKYLIEGDGHVRA
ncbi:MAG TPA: glutamate-5-semialdehyde dehydrogenase [Solirubrobacteraceae bacterium]|nr:glutamate-5-semialdehyde dehydrogenase [Solirubrobacteraceae bacterium]